MARISFTKKRTTIFAGKGSAAFKGIKVSANPELAVNMKNVTKRPARKIEVQRRKRMKNVFGRLLRNYRVSALESDTITRNKKMLLVDAGKQPSEWNSIAMQAVIEFAHEDITKKMSRLRGKINAIAQKINAEKKYAAAENTARFRQYAAEDIREQFDLIHEYFRLKKEKAVLSMNSSPKAAENQFHLAEEKAKRIKKVKDYLKEFIRTGKVIELK